jgi:hypothetical protein
LLGRHVNFGFEIVVVFIHSSNVSKRAFHMPVARAKTAIAIAISALTLSQNHQF